MATSLSTTLGAITVVCVIGTRVQINGAPDVEVTNE